MASTVGPTGEENGWMSMRLSWDDHEVGKEWAAVSGDARDWSVVGMVGTGVLPHLGVGESSS